MRLDAPTPQHGNAEFAPPFPPLTLDVNETAQALRCGRSTVYELIASGELTSIKLGRRRLVTYASCADLVERLAAR